MQCNDGIQVAVQCRKHELRLRPSEVVKPDHPRPGDGFDAASPSYLCRSRRRTGQPRCHVLCGEGSVSRPSESPQRAAALSAVLRHPPRSHPLEPPARRARARRRGRAHRRGRGLRGCAASPPALRPPARTLPPPPPPPHTRAGTDKRASLSFSRLPPSILTPTPHPPSFPLAL
jgi:hypothetical protein